MTSNTLALNGQVALVTGASSGLGRATALAFAQAGVDVVLLARTTADLQQVNTELGSTGRLCPERLPLGYRQTVSQSFGIDHECRHNPGTIRSLFRIHS